MPALLALMLALALAGCGRTVDEAACHEAEVLSVNEGSSLLEIAGEQPRARIIRKGVFGQPGDRFRLCERIVF